MSRRRATKGSETLHTEQQQSSLDDGRGFFSQLLSIDSRITQRMAICADKNSPLGNIRPLMKLLEISCHGVPWILGNVLALLMSHRQETREKLLNLFAALILDLVIVVIVKAAVRRQRPAHNDMDMFATISVDKFSFPSGHATRAATVACFFITHFSPGHLWDLSMLVWAGCVSISRIMLGRHHVLDVIFGMFIGVMQYQLLVHLLWLPSDTCETILGPMQEELHL